MSSQPGKSPSNHPFDNEFLITRKQKEQFRRDGFVKLDGFLNADVVDMLLNRLEGEMSLEAPGTFKADSHFTQAKYDFKSDKTEVYELMERPYFRRALTDLSERDLFLTFELCFEIEKNVSRGFPWHVGTQSFGYQVAEEFGCTLWAPLHPIDTKGQRGGMAYVPDNVISGDFVYHYIEPALVSTLETKERGGIMTNIDEYFAMRVGILNSSTMCEILENHQVEDDFEPGDALLFNKMVVHRSIILGEGALPTRAAYVMRFIDAGSHYDLQRAQNLEFPVEKYGKRGLSPYKPFTRQHIEIAEAGTPDGAVLAESPYFDNRDRRTLRRERSTQAG